MPPKPYRFEDHGRSARYKLRNRVAGIGVNNTDTSDSESALSSDASDMQVDDCELSHHSSLHHDQSDQDNGNNTEDDSGGSISLHTDQDEGADEIVSVNEESDEEIADDINVLDAASEGTADNDEADGDVNDADDSDISDNPDAGSNGDEGDENDGDDSEPSDNPDSGSDSEEEQDIGVDGNVVLCPHSPITVGESMHMVLSMALNHNLTEEREKEYFITIPIIPQIRTMYKREGFFEKLSYRFNRVKTHENNLEDIYDGEIYRTECVDRGFLSDPNAISFCWNSDGVPIYKSSKYSIWPFFLRINELPYQERVRKENTLMCALWFGNKKPIVNMFLLPLFAELRSLHEGIQVDIPGQPNPVRVKGMIVYGTCDMPAKCLFLNFVSYNGYYGCTACTQRGERLANNRHVYRYLNHEPLRTEEETEHFADLAAQFREPSYGVKGISILSRFVPNYVTSCAIDPMHKYSGIIKKLLEIWFSSEYHEHQASMNEHFMLVDNRIRNMKPPNFIERLPRSLSHLKYWKISELKAFLFAYGIPCLHDIMTPLYFNHFLLLVSGLFLLNKESISPDVLQLGSALLREFVAQYEDLYGIENMTCNIHQLLHLGTFVKRLGPLWTASCAPFESMNGVLKKYVHGTRYADIQVCTAASLYMGMAVLRDRDLRVDGPVLEFCQRLSERQKRLRLTAISDTVSAADKLKLLAPVPAHVRDVLTQANVPIGILHVCKKVLYKKRLLVGQSYTRAKKTISYCIKFRHQEENCIGKIQYFLKVQLCDCQILCQCPGICYALVSLYEIQNTFSTRAPRFQLPFIHECRPTNVTIAVRVESVLAQCFLLSVQTIAAFNKVYAVEPVNNLESDD